MLMNPDHSRTHSPLGLLPLPQTDTGQCWSLPLLGSKSPAWVSYKELCLLSLGVCREKQYTGKSILRWRNTSLVPLRPCGANPMCRDGIQNQVPLNSKFTRLPSPRERVWGGFMQRLGCAPGSPSSPHSPSALAYLF